MREGGGNCLKYLKRGWEEKRGGKTKILKGGGGSWVKAAGTPLRTMPNIRRLEQVRDTKFGANVCNVIKCCKNCKVTAFTVSELLREIQQGR